MSGPKLECLAGGCLEPPVLPRPLSWHGFPAVLHHRRDGSSSMIAEGPLGLLAETLLCIPPAARNDFIISFAFAIESEAKP
jgi:hypothetical protein